MESMTCTNMFRKHGLKPIVWASLLGDAQESEMPVTLYDESAKTG